jgi:CheY-like chemotaxis protein
MPSVLIIDDELDIRDSVARVLRKVGYEVRTAATGQDGVAAFREHPAELVITDMIMPKGHGLDAIRTLREEYPKVPILAISGGGNFALQRYKAEAITTSAYLAAATDAGANRTLTKPFDSATLLEVVMDLCPIAKPQRH